jgi:AraC family L-rhamnose operon transcriptional activator RhaR
VGKAINLLSADAFPIVVDRMRPQDDMRLHHHENLELVVITGGTGAHCTAQDRFELRRGDVFVVPIGMFHGYHGCRALHLINLAYDPGRLELPLHRLQALPGYQPLVLLEPRLRQRYQFAGHLHLDERQIARIEAAIQDLETELVIRQAGWEHAAGAHLLHILVCLARHYAAQQGPAARLAVQLASVLAYIEQHLGSELSVLELAGVGHMSPTTLQRSFHSLLGTSVRQHVLALRLQAARERLLGGDERIRAIAQAVGIPDQNYFSRLFHQRVGSTPRDFRAAARRRQGPGRPRQRA